MKLTSFIAILLFLNACQEQKARGNGHSLNKKANFHIYLLMGQSNMAGRGKVAPVDTITHPRVLMLDRNHKWVLAKNPVHFDKPIAGTGLGLEFGKLMAESNKQVTIGLVPCAKGGSSINNWFPDSLHQATKSYPYQEMVVKSKKALLEGTLKGILWHQGEADTDSHSEVADYPEKFHRMIGLLKTELDIASLPIVIGELGSFFTERKPLADKLNEVFDQMAEDNPCIEIVRTDGLTHKGDSVHFDANSYRILGQRYAARMKQLQTICQQE